VRPAAAAVALVEQHDPVGRGVELAAVVGRAAGTRAAVDHQYRLSAGISADLPVDFVAIADIEQAGVVGFDRRVKGAQLHDVGLSHWAGAQRVAAGGFATGPLPGVRLRAQSSMSRQTRTAPLEFLM
jgi:hypothetical protein